MTRKCIDLARVNTAIPFELIIVESGSQYFSDEADIFIYEKSLASSAERSHNRGFQVARTDYITLLTNDVFVDVGWLEAMLECFKIPDCGCATLASSQFNHNKTKKIEEGNWWSVAMIPQKTFEQVGYYDERFRDSWCDTDLLLRIYKTGKKMYRNFDCVVEHLIGQTNYSKPGFKDNYEMGRLLFNEKHKGCELPIFQQMR
jgi:GT2 family glycosyltransferase